MLHSVADPDTGSGIKHPGSATLRDNKALNIVPVAYRYYRKNGTLNYRFLDTRYGSYEKQCCGFGGSSSGSNVSKYLDSGSGHFPHYLQ
jgi:hypothetical protein